MVSSHTSRRQEWKHPILFLLLGGCLLYSCKHTKDTSETTQSPAVLGDPVKAIAEIMKPPLENKIDGFKVFYRPWIDPALPVTEIDLLNMTFDSKTVFRDGFACAFVLADPLKTFTFHEVPEDSWDCRISFVYTAADKDVLRFTLVRQSGVVLINGKGYKATRALVDKLMIFVPHFDFMTYDQLWPELAGQPDTP